jgi:F-type H+-transporting ATPase subunit a
LFVWDELNEVYYLRGTEDWPLEWTVTPHVTSIAIITVLLLLLFLVINRKIKTADPLEKPKGLLFLAEMFVSTIDDFTENMLGKKLKQLSPYVGFLGIYLFIANTFGLLGFTTPTSSISVTFTFGITSFILIRYYGIKFNRWEHFKGLANPWPLTPINVIGELAIPFSLSIRLFGNILSGTIIMALIYGALGLVSPYLEVLTGFTLLVPVLHVYFDLFSGLIQTFVFILLSLVFISNASE